MTLLLLFFLTFPPLCHAGRSRISICSSSGRHAAFCFFFLVFPPLPRPLLLVAPLPNVLPLSPLHQRPKFIHRNLTLDFPLDFFVWIQTDDAAADGDKSVQVFLFFLFFCFFLFFYFSFFFYFFFFLCSLQLKHMSRIPVFFPPDFGLLSCQLLLCASQYFTAYLTSTWTHRALGLQSQ